jgi:hypothetical protein
VQDYERKHQILIPYCMLNIESKETDISERHGQGALTANTLKVGDNVEFQKDGESIVGRITRLNYKTVTLVTKTHGRWRVAYSQLSRVYDIDSYSESPKDSVLLGKHESVISLKGR